MSHFTVLVIGDDPEGQLAPYHEFECTGRNDRYVQEIDKTAKVQAEVDAGRALDDVLSDYGWDENVVDDESKVRVGRIVVDRDDHGDKGEDAPHKFGYAVVKDGKLVKAVDRTNLNKRWDWYVLGGRWSGFFKLKAGVRGRLGRPGAFNNEVKPGHADQALKRDVDFEGMERDAAAEAREHYRKVRAIISDVPFPLTFAEVRARVGWEEGMQHDVAEELIERARKAYREQPAIMKLNDPTNREVWDPFAEIESFACSEDEHAKRHVLKEMRTFAVVKDGKWYERGEMGWFGIVLGEKEDGEWDKQYHELLKGPPARHAAQRLRLPHLTEGWDGLAAWVLVGLNVLDAASTLVVLARGAGEVNPLAAATLSLAGPASFVAVKAAWAGLLAAGLLQARRRGSRLAGPGLLVCVAAYAVLAAWHVKLLAA